jgi:late competence protein required for DNA uptake (superfamily II DNA/RNA helicase)
MQFEDRDRVVGEFRRGETKILISTDVLSRGFDVSQVRATLCHTLRAAAAQLLLLHGWRCVCCACCSSAEAST